LLLTGARSGMKRSPMTRTSREAMVMAGLIPAVIIGPFCRGLVVALWSSFLMLSIAVRTKSEKTNGSS
jgi:hypothetical protein